MLKYIEGNRWLRQLLKKRKEYRKHDFIEMKKMIAKLFCLTHFTGDQDIVITSDASLTELAKTLRQEHNDKKVRPIAVVSRYLNEAEKRCSVGELETLTVVWGSEKFHY